MRFPKESLDDFKGPKKQPSIPPAKVWLEWTGETEQLKPLARWEGPLKANANAGNFFRHLSWFHRSLAMAGSLTVVTFLLGTGLYLIVYGPPVDQQEDLAVEQPLETLTSTSQPNTVDIPSTANDPSLSDDLRSVSPSPRRRQVRARISQTIPQPRPIIHRSLREWLHPPLWVSQFFPTKTIIFIENGVVRTRVEPQVVSDYKKPASNSN